MSAREFHPTSMTWNGRFARGYKIECSVCRAVMKVPAGTAKGPPDDQVEWRHARHKFEKAGWQVAKRARDDKCAKCAAVEKEAVMSPPEPAPEPASAQLIGQSPLNLYFPETWVAPGRAGGIVHVAVPWGKDVEELKAYIANVEGQAPIEPELPPPVKTIVDVHDLVETPEELMELISPQWHARLHALTRPSPTSLPPGKDASIERAIRVARASIERAIRVARAHLAGEADIPKKPDPIHSKAWIAVTILRYAPELVTEDRLTTGFWAAHRIAVARKRMIEAPAAGKFPRVESAGLRGARDEGARQLRAAPEPGRTKLQSMLDDLLRKR